MTNITIGPGGGVVANGVVTYLPSCSVISYGDISYSAAEAYDITSTEYLEVGRVGQRLSGGGVRSLPSHAATSCSDDPILFIPAMRPVPHAAAATALRLL